MIYTTEAMAAEAIVNAAKVSRLRNREGYVTYRQVRAIVNSTKTSNWKYLFKQGDYIYYTTKYLIVRWNIENIEALKTLPDNSVLYTSRLKEWLKLADKDARLYFQDAMTAEAWYQPPVSPADGCKYFAPYTKRDDTKEVVTIDTDYLSTISKLVNDDPTYQLISMGYMQDTPGRAKEGAKLLRIVGSRADVTACLVECKRLNDSYKTCGDAKATTEKVTSHQPEEPQHEHTNTISTRQQRVSKLQRDVLKDLQDSGHLVVSMVG